MTLSWQALALIGTLGKDFSHSILDSEIIGNWLWRTFCTFNLKVLLPLKRGLTKLFPPRMEVRPALYLINGLLPLGRLFDKVFGGEWANKTKFLSEMHTTRFYEKMGGTQVSLDDYTPIQQHRGLIVIVCYLSDKSIIQIRRCKRCVSYLEKYTSTWWFKLFVIKDHG